MEADNLIFSSKIDSDVEDVCFDILMSYFQDEDFSNVYVERVVISPSEIIFFVDIEERKSIIRVPIKKD